jgi:hypothetical protein
VNPSLSVTATTEEVAEAFGRWWKHGKTRRSGHESFDYQRCSVRFLEGWRDSENHVSDFKRRGMPHENGERSAYMAARFLSACSRQVKRGLIQPSEAAEIA